MLNDKQKFTEYGYAFVMGLVGSYEPKKGGSMTMKKRRFNIYSDFSGGKRKLWRGELEIFHH